MLYLYPPTLADLMVPLTLLSPSAAFLAWNALNLIMIVLLSGALTRMLDMKFMGATILVAAATLLFRPTLSTIHWGEVSVLLTFLVIIGLSLYLKGHDHIAMILLALAIAIKLVPLIVILPLIAWRKWKSLRLLAIWCVVILAGLWAVNGRETLNLFFLHQLPAMSSGDLGSGEFSSNRALGNIFYTCLGGAHPIITAPAIAWLVRAISALTLCYAVWLSRSKTSENLTNRQQLEIFLVPAFSLRHLSILMAARLGS